MSPNTDPGTPVLPVTLSWYRDAANWVVGLSTGALAAGFTYREPIQSAPPFVRGVFVAAAILFLVALVAGIQFYFWLTTYGNQRERRERVAAGMPQTRKEEQEKEVALQDAEQRLQRASRRYGYFYALLLWAFHLGVLGYAVVTASLFTRPRPTPEAWQIVALPCCPGARCRVSQPHVLRIETTTGRAWYLAADSLAPVSWTRITE